MSSGRSVIHGVIFWLLAVMVAALGAWYSLHPVLDGNWFARSGCFIVVLGIWSGIGGVIEEQVMREALNLEKRLVMTRIRFRDRKDPESREKAISERQKRFDERTKMLENRLKTSFGFLEASLLVTGTLIWGFGDLIQYIPQ